MLFYSALHLSHLVLSELDRPIQFDQGNIVRPRIWNVVIAAALVITLSVFHFKFNSLGMEMKSDRAENLSLVLLEVFRPQIDLDLVLQGFRLVVLFPEAKNTLDIALVKSALCFPYSQRSALSLLSKQKQCAAVRTYFRLITLPPH